MQGDFSEGKLKRGDLYSGKAFETQSVVFYSPAKPPQSFL